MNYGRKGHPPDNKLKQEIFICYVLDKLRQQPDKRTREILFETLVWGRDDIEYIREEIKRRW